MNRAILRRKEQSGVGLVELLIAMVLALVLTMGIIEVFLGSKQAYRTQDALSRVQENGRFAMEELSRNIRMAGFQGCGNMNVLAPNVIANGFPAGNFWSTNAIRGYRYDDSFDPAYVATVPGAAAAPSPLADTDVVSLIKVDDCDTYLTTPMSADNDNVTINPANACDIQIGDPILITDCATADLFSVTASALGVIGHDNALNSTARLSKPYGTDARVYKFIQVEYFVQQNNFGEPALFKRENGGAPIELVEGLEDLVIQFGEDTDNDFFVDGYGAAAGVTDWSRVSSVRPVLSLRSKTDNIALREDPVRNDKRLRQDMTSTIGIRNRLP